MHCGTFARCNLFPIDYQKVIIHRGSPRKIVFTSQFLYHRSLALANILIVDDNPVDRLLVSSIVEKTPQWKSQSVASAQEALLLMEQEVPDLLITDLQLPEMNGIELVAEIRKQLPSLPILLVTHSDNAKMAMEALSAGATSFSPKQSLEKDLPSTIAQLLDVAQATRYTHDLSFCPMPGHQMFVLDNELSMIGPTIENLQSHLPAWSDRDRLQIGMAIEEAITNAMHHGNLEIDSALREGKTDQRYYDAVADRKQDPCYYNRKVRIEAEFSDRHICIQISDEGPGFEPKDVGDPREAENLRRVSGRGLLLIRTFMDQVVHNSVGNQITMTKLRER